MSESNPVGWVVTRDHMFDETLTEGDLGYIPSRVGFGARLEDARGDAESWLNQVTIDTGLTAKDIEGETTRWRVLDDDGEVYYSGVMRRDWAEGDETLAFHPLEWARPDAGACDIQLRSALGTWVTQ